MINPMENSDKYEYTYIYGTTNYVKKTAVVANNNLLMQNTDVIW